MRFLFYLRLFGVSFLCLCAASALRALDLSKPAGDFHFRSWKTMQGLPSETVRAGAVASDGNLWLATALGVARFDGLKFERVDTSSIKIPVGNCYDVRSTDDGSVYIATPFGLIRHKDGVLTRIGIAQGLPGNFVRTLGRNERDELYVGTDRSLSVLDKEGKIRVLVAEFPVDSIIRGVCETSDGRICVASQGGLWMVSKTGDCERISGGSRFPETAYTSVIRGQGGGLWIGSTKGVFALKPDGSVDRVGRNEGLGNLSVLSLCEDRDGALWIGTTGGLFRRRPGRPVEAAHYFLNLDAATILSILEDSQGNLWLMTNNGLFSLSNTPFKTVGLAQGLEQLRLYAVLEGKDGDWWIGAAGGALFRYRFSTDRATPVFSAPVQKLETIYSMSEDGEGGLFLGSSTGLFRFRCDGSVDDLNFPDKYASAEDLRARARAEPVPWIIGARVNCIVPTGDGRFLVGTRFGLYTRDRNGMNRLEGVEDGLAGNFVRSVLLARDGSLWCVTPTDFFDNKTQESFISVKRDGKWRCISAKESMTDFTVRGLYEDSVGDIWVTTVGVGLRRYSNGVWQAFSKEQGLADDYISGLVEDASGFLWIGCTRGLMRIPRSQFDAYAAGAVKKLNVELFTETDGLPGAEFRESGAPNVIRSRGGVLGFPTNHGVCIVRPDDAALPRSRPRVVLGTVSVSENPMDIRGGLVLPPDPGNLAIRFSTPLLYGAERVRARYRLLPLATEWVDLGDQRTISFAQLHRGRYKLEIAAGYDGEDWQIDRAELSIEVQPHFYERPLFLVLALFVLTSGVVWFVRVRILRSHDKAQRLQTMNDALERRVAERTRELVAAKEMAEGATRTKSRFLANVSHEIRTPMNGVLGMSTLLLETELTDEQRDYALTMRRSAESLLSIINDILDLSKIEAGKFTLEQAPFSPLVAVEDSLEIVSPLAEAKSLDLVKEADSETPAFVMGDQGRLRQVLLNLVGNAIKFSSRARVIVRLKVAEADDSSCLLRFEVQDFGIGIKAEDQRMLFQPFTQVDPSSRRRHMGTGLGLAISKQLANLMGGEIGVDSEPGRGSLFWFTARFAIVRAARSASVEGVKPGLTSDGERSLFRKNVGGGHVLVAEDNAVNQAITVRFVEKMGLTCEVVSNGLLAVQAVADRHFDLVLMDCQMPEMDGVEATGKIRKAGHVRSSLPIIAMTASASEEERARCLAGGMNDFVGKPISVEELTRCLEKWLERGKKPRV